MAAIGSLVVDLIAQTASFNSNIEKAARTLNSNAARMNRAVQGVQRQIGALGNYAKGAAAGLTGYISIDAARQALDFAAGLGETAAQLGVTTRDLQVYRYAATQAGLSQEEMDAGLAKLSRSLGEAALGAKKPSAVFKALGIDIRKAGGEVKTAGEIMPEFAEALSKIESPAQRAAVMTQLLGRNGQKMAALLADGAAGVNDYAAAAERLGLVISDEKIAAADQAADDLAALTQVLQVNIASAVAANAGSIVKLADGIGKVGAALGTINPSQWKMVMGAAAAGAAAGFVSPVPGGALIGGLVAGGLAAANAADANAERAAVRPGPLATGFKFVNGKLVPSAPKSAPKPTPPTEIEGLLAGTTGGTAKVDVFGQSMSRLNEQLAVTKLELQAVNENWPDSELDAARLRQQLYNDIASVAPDITKAQRAELTGLADALVDQERALSAARMSQDIATNSAERYAEAIQGLTDDVKGLSDGLSDLPDLSIELPEGVFDELEADRDFAGAIGDSFGYAAEDAAMHMDNILDVARAFVGDLARIFLRRNLTLPIADTVTGWADSLMGNNVPTPVAGGFDAGSAMSGADGVLAQLGAEGSTALNGLTSAAQNAGTMLDASMVPALGQAVTSTITTATTEGIAAGALQGLTASAVAASAALSAMATQQTVSGLSSIAMASGAPGFATGGLPGGLITGPGTGTSDSILARVSTQEFITNAAATRANLPLLNHLNSGGTLAEYVKDNTPGFFLGGLIGKKFSPLGLAGKALGINLPSLSPMGILGNALLKKPEKALGGLMGGGLDKAFAGFAGAMKDRTANDGGGFNFNGTINVSGNMSPADARRTGRQLMAGMAAEFADARRRGIA